MIKKIISILFVALLFSCNNATTDSAQQELTPPTWIIGTWENSSGLIGATFTNDNILERAGNREVSYKDTYSGYITETVNNDKEYAVKITFSGTTYTFKYEKINDNSINYYSYSSVIVLTKL